jgi:hypothetical protein
LPGAIIAGGSGRGSGGDPAGERFEFVGLDRFDHGEREPLFGGHFPGVHPAEQATGGGVAGNNRRARASSAQERVAGSQVEIGFPLAATVADGATQPQDGEGLVLGDLLGGGGLSKAGTPRQPVVQQFAFGGGEGCFAGRGHDARGDDFIQPAVVGLAGREDGARLGPLAEGFGRVEGEVSFLSFGTVALGAPQAEDFGQAIFEDRRVGSLGCGTGRDKE